ncbi:NAD(P)-binding domain-containing protein [Mesorhizobium sp.]|uniref:NAD(P)-binding domain-containing protein n=1 Tax=Mesorhizobium sp. TaxID=1871066 RepID=UPI0011F94507|nr:NAD(P)-binding domain-containing protein [Mesorhizobium sp.]TIN75218.1 MAG: NAD(P)/FAD-dependent oxidoreductase [Mesorhizobium sp.]
MISENDLPIAIIGGGPVGLAAAAQLVSRGLSVKVYEAGSSVGENLRDWGHLRVFTPWRYCVDAVARKRLESHGWQMPEPEAFPTANEIVDQYLAPLAKLAELAPSIETNARVVAISRWGADKVLSKSRQTRPFMLLVETAKGTRRDSARAVIDASGTWQTPNPLGAGGLPAEGETELGDRIAYGIPNVLGRDRHLYAGRTILVVGAGHSAANALLELAELAQTEPGTSALWVTRSTDLVRIYGGGDADALPARGELGSGVRQLAESGRVRLVTGFAIVAIREIDGRLMVEGQTEDGLRTLGPVDRIIAATGQRPDLALTRELRLDLDPWLEGVKALGPLIDPNEHSCGDVPPHGHRELSHPEPDFYTVGVKSYGRAPTFLLLTGYEQVRSVAAALAGDMAAADAVQLVLPKTGVCTVPVSLSGVSSQNCCGGPAPAAVDACCVDDAKAKASGKSGCGSTQAVRSDDLEIAAQ